MHQTLQVRPIQYSVRELLLQCQFLKLVLVLGDRRPRTLSRPSATTVNDTAFAGFIPETTARQTVRNVKRIADLESKVKDIGQSQYVEVY
jgi:hypothetical protein